MGTENHISYKQFGEIIARYREKNSITQGELAKRVGVEQQTVSRWELGMSRPRLIQLAELSKILNIRDTDALRIAAGYEISMKGSSSIAFVKPFPLDALTWEEFERFSYSFLSGLYPDGKVHHIGGPGHTQGGADLCVTFKDGSCHDFQCKREKNFGSAKVIRAIEEYKRLAKEKVILLSRVATPAARAEIKNHQGWDIWDVEDISAKIRMYLSKDARTRLVDTFFRGQHMALLGEPESGPWQTVEEFFAPFSLPTRIFNHTWNFVGREKEVEQILSGLEAEDVSVVFLSGAGGSGKTRILKEVCTRFMVKHPERIVRILSPTEDITKTSLDDLGDQEKILIVDDAHEQELGSLFQKAATPDSKIKILLLLRPYGLAPLIDHAFRFALSEEAIKTVKLDLFTIVQATELAKEVLTQVGGVSEIAEAIARITYDCPLATVIGAFLVTKNQININHIKHEGLFRSELLGKFKDVITGSLGTPSDTEPLRKLLKCIALLQPIHLDDEKFKSLVETIEGIPPHDTGRLFRLLANAGVLFKRGRLYRLSPDLLADFIIQDASFGVDGASTGYAEKIFEHIAPDQLKNFLLNLGKLDWRLSHQDRSSNRLLDSIWKRLEAQRNETTVEAVTAVAPFQPERALRFAEVLIREDSQMEGVSRLLRNVSYDLKSIPETCVALWELGKQDMRELHRNPDHPVRILKELCAVEPHKSIEYNQMLVEFALSLLSQENAWEGHSSPLDILEGIFQLEGFTATSKGATLTMNRYRVRVEAVASLRAKARDAVLGLLSNPNRNKALNAARFLGKVLQPPIGGFRSEEERISLLSEFKETFEKLRDIVKSGNIDDLVLIEILRKTHWHKGNKDHSKDPIASLAQEIALAMPRTIKFRTLLALVNWGFFSMNATIETNLERKEAEIDDLAKDLLETYPVRTGLLDFISSLLDDIKIDRFQEYIPAFQLLKKLMHESIPFTRAVISYSKDYPESAIATIAAGSALAILSNFNYEEGFRAVKKFMRTGDPDLLKQVAGCYSLRVFKEGNYSQDDLNIIRGLLTSSNLQVVNPAVAAVYRLAKIDKRQAIDLLLTVDFASFPDVAHKVLMCFYDDKTLPFSELTPNDIKAMLAKLIPVQELDDYWIRMFLSKTSCFHSELTASFFMARVEKRVMLLAGQNEKGIGILDSQAWKYRVCISDISPGEKLRFRDSADSPEIMKKMWEWMRKKGNQDQFPELSGELFFSMFGPLDTQILPFLKNKIDEGTPTDSLLVSQILSHADSLFVFEQRPFVTSFLEKAKALGREMYDQVFSSLLSSSTCGVKKGIHGEPFPEDVRMRDESEKALSETLRFSPAYPFYETLKKHAEWNIKKTLLVREAFDEDEL